MIALGGYGMLGALKVYQEKRNKRDHDLSYLGPVENTESVKSLGNSLFRINGADHVGKSTSNLDFTSMSTNRDDEVSADNILPHADQGHSLL